jgi:hypothetical protein
VEGGRIVQPHQLAEIGETNAFAVTGDFLQNGKRAAQRLHAAAGALLGLVVDIGFAGRHQLGD